jgi:signal transduction histidine kinase
VLLSVTRRTHDCHVSGTHSYERYSALGATLKPRAPSCASHELRTPLNAILGWARILRSGSVDPSGFMRGFETIERNAVAQVQLIEDILDGSRIRKAKPLIKPTSAAVSGCE